MIHPGLLGLLFFFFLFESGSQCIAQTDQKLLFSFLSPLSAGIVGMYPVPRYRSFFVCFLVVLEFELRALHLLGRHSTS
jgi:hypothetical protein